MTAMPAFLLLVVDEGAAELLAPPLAGAVVVVLLAPLVLDAALLEVLLAPLVLLLLPDGVAEALPLEADDEESAAELVDDVAPPETTLPPETLPGPFSLDALAAAAL